MARDLALLIPEIAVLLTAVGALIAEMLRRPESALLVAVSGLIVATGLTVSLIGEDTTVFGGSFRGDDLSVCQTHSAAGHHPRHIFGESGCERHRARGHGLQPALLCHHRRARSGRRG